MNFAPRGVRPRVVVFTRPGVRAYSSISGLTHFWRHEAYGVGYRTVCGADNDASNVPTQPVTCFACMDLGQ